MAVCLQLPAANCQDRALRKIGSRFSAAAARTDMSLDTEVWKRLRLVFFILPSICLVVHNFFCIISIMDLK